MELKTRKYSITYDTRGHIQVNRYDAEGLRAKIEENEILTKFIFHFLYAYLGNLLKRNHIKNIT